MKKLSECPVCGQSTAAARSVGTYRRRIARRPWQAVLVECSACQHAFSNPQPTSDELAPYYGTDYHVFTGERADPKPIAAAVLARGDDHYLHVPIVPRGEFLDIGCANGELLAVMQALGMNVRGVEVSPNSARIARDRGFDVFQGTLDQAKFPDVAFDCVSLMHVLEHVHEPVPLLAECLRILKPGGRLTVIVPNFRSLTFAELGLAWIGLDLPRHIHQFTSDSLRRATLNAGFDSANVTDETYLGLVEASCLAWYARRYFVPRKLMAKLGLASRQARELTDRANAMKDRGEVLILIAVRK